MGFISLKNKITHKLFMIYIVFASSFSSLIADSSFECSFLFKNENDTNIQQALEFYSEKLKTTYLSILDKSINKINELTQSEAHDLYVIIMFFKYKIYPSSVDEKYKQYILSRLETNDNSSMFEDKRLDEILHISPNTSYLTLLEQEKKNSSNLVSMNYDSYIKEYQQELKHVISTLNFFDSSKKNSSDIFESSFKLLDRVSYKIYEVLTFRMIFNTLDPSHFKEFGILDFSEHFKQIESITVKIYRSLHLKLYQIMYSLIEKANLKNIELFLHATKNRVHDSFFSFKTDSSLNFSKSKLFISLFSYKDFINHSVNYIEKHLNIDPSSNSLDQIIEKIEPIFYELFEDFFKIHMPNSDIKELNLKSTYYSKTLMYLMLGLTYWIHKTDIDYELNDFTNLDETNKYKIIDLYHIYTKLNDFNKNILCWYLSDLLTKYRSNSKLSQRTLVSIITISFAGMILANSTNSDNPEAEVMRAIKTLPSEYEYNLTTYIQEYFSLGDNGDISILINLIRVIFTNPRFDKYINSLRINISNSYKQLDSIFSTTKKLDNGYYILKKLVHILSQSTNNFNDLMVVLDICSKYQPEDLLDDYFKELDVDLFIEQNPASLDLINQIFSQNSIISKYMKINPFYSNFKRLILFYLQRKDKLNFDEFTFLISLKNNFDINDNIFISHLKSLSIKDIANILNQKKYLSTHEFIDSVISKILDYSNDEFSKCNDEELSSIISFLINHSGSLKVQNKIVFILESFPNCYQNIIDQCSTDGYLSTQSTFIKDFLIKHGFIKKTPKIKRTVSKQKIDQGFSKQESIKSVDIQTIIKELMDNLDSNSAFYLAYLFNKLVREQNNSSQLKSNGKKEVKEIQKSLDLILKMIQNFSIDNYPILKQVFYLSLDQDSLIFLIDNSKNYKIKDKIYSIVDYWISNNRFSSSSNLEFGIDLIYQLYNVKNPIFSNSQFYNIILKLLNKTELRSNNNLDSLIKILLEILKTDLKDTKSNKTRITSKLSLDKILDLVSIISKYETKTEGLRILIKQILDPKISFDTPSQTTIFLLELNKKLIDTLENLSPYKKIIVLSILSDEAYLYLKNNSSLHFGSNLKLLGKNLYKSSDSKYIQDLYSQILLKLNKTPSLFDLIETGLTTINQWDKNNFNESSFQRFREQISIYEVLLYEINHGYIAVDYSSKENIGLGFDVFSTSNSIYHYIEVKSKMSLFSKEFPPSISLNEARIALSIHSESNPQEYLIYLVPLSKKEREKFSPVVNIDINWFRLEYLYSTMKDPMYDNPNYQIIDSSKKIFLKDFSNNLFIKYKNQEI